MLRRNIIAVATLLALSLLPAVTAGAPSRLPNTVLVLGRLSDDGSTLDPARAGTFTGIFVIQQVYDTLVDFTPDLSRPVPELAASWTASPDGKTYTFTLRRGVKFHNGNPVTAAAVEFSLRRVFQVPSEISFIMTSFIARPEDVRTAGPERVQITFSQPMPERLMASVMSNEITSIIDPALIRAHTSADDPWASKWLDSNDAGSGPFKLVSWNRNVRVELQAFEEYWRGSPKLRRVLMVIIPEPTAQLLALQRGEIDIALALLPSQYRELERSASVEVMSAPTFTVRYLAMNAGHEAFAMKEVRTAVKWAIDYDALTRIWEGTVQPGQTIVPAGMFGHLPVRPYRKNPDRARSLLQQAGLARVKAELLTFPAPPNPDIAVKIREDLGQVGIEVEIRLVRPAELFGIYGARKHQLITAQWFADYADPDNLAKAFADFDAGALARLNQWDHPVKRLVHQAVEELDQRKRAEFYRRIQGISLEEGPYAVVGYPLRQVALLANVKGLSLSPLPQKLNLFPVFKE